MSTTPPDPSPQGVWAHLRGLPRVWQVLLGGSALIFVLGIGATLTGAGGLAPKDSIRAGEGLGAGSTCQEYLDASVDERKAFWVDAFAGRSLTDDQAAFLANDEVLSDLAIAAGGAQIACTIDTGFLKIGDNQLRYEYQSDDAGDVSTEAESTVADPSATAAAPEPPAEADSVPPAPSSGQQDQAYRVRDGNTACVVYQGFNSDGHAVKCGRRGSSEGLVLPSAGASRATEWQWPDESLFVVVAAGQTLYLRGGSARLQGDDSDLRCEFDGDEVRCDNGDGYAIAVSRSGSTRIAP